MTRGRGLVLCGALTLGSVGIALSQAALQWEQYAAEVPKSVLELQPLRQTSSMEFQVPRSGRGTARLINLNPNINAWFILQLASPLGVEDSYHLENPHPMEQRLTLNADHNGILLTGKMGSANCVLWPEGNPRILEEARHSLLPDAPLCNDRLFLRNRTVGAYTHLERVTDFLRDHVWGGDQLVGFVRKEFFKDAFIERGSTVIPKSGVSVSAANGPQDALLDPTYREVAVKPGGLGLAIAESELGLGRWYQVPGTEGIFLSGLLPKAADRRVIETSKESVHSLDSVEASALDYFVAFDLSKFTLGFELGTAHPRVGWSERVAPEMRDPTLPGPDGIGNAAPLVLNGIVNPALVQNTVAAFAGGFKREHGAFRYGALSKSNHGNHYGFLEQGVVISKLQPGLATLIVGSDATVAMKTWREEDNARLFQIRYARQNGVPLVEEDATGESRAGSLVGKWGEGNWSGSSDEQLRTVRAGACMQTYAGRQFLIYGYFSAATPSAMAAAFLAYHCHYAMHLDMNALEHTYLALYLQQQGHIVVQHLIEGMSAVDRKGGDSFAPRFLSFPDDRDFFYVLRRDPP